MKLAVFTPLNPARCGVSDYSEALLPHLAGRFETTVFVDNYTPQGFHGSERLEIRPAGEFRSADYGAALYHIGNNPYHVYAYDAALAHPGIVVLHEFNLHHLIADATIKRDRWEEYLREAEYNGGQEALAHAKRVQALEVGPDYDAVPMNRRLLETSQALIVHSRFLRDQVREAGFSLPVGRIPHGAWIPEVNRNRYRTLLGVEENTVLIGIFGFLKPYKRIAESLRAMQRLVRLNPNVKMILVGEEHPDFPLRRLIAQLELSPFVRVLGHVPISEFEQYIGAVDVCLNLRYPTAGETSGTLLRSLGLGRATLVSDVGAFADLPDDICMKVPAGEGEVDLILEYLTLLVNRPEVARALGKRARDYVATECSWPHVGELYAEWIEAVAGGRPETDWNIGKECGRDEQDGEKSEAASGTVEEPRLPQAEDEVREADSSTEPAGPAEERRIELASYLRGLRLDSADNYAYLENHLARLVRTLELTPFGSAEDRVLEMGAYMQLTPALKHKLGYGDVRGCYLGPLGKTDHRKVETAAGETFECEIDLFNAERDVYPYGDASFSTVLCCELLEHLFEDPMHMMAEVNRILEPGGRVVLSTPNVCSFRAVGAILLGYHPGLFHEYIKPNEKGEVAPRHSREYAPRDVQLLLEAAGFEVERIETGPYKDGGTAEHDWVKHLVQRYELPGDLRGEVIYAVGKKVSGVVDRYPDGLYSGEEG